METKCRQRMGPIWWWVCGAYCSLVRAGTGVGAGAQPGSACLSSSSPRLPHRDTILRLLPDPSLSRGGDPGPFRESSGVLFSKKPVLREIQVIRGRVGQQGPQHLTEARIQVQGELCLSPAWPCPLAWCCPGSNALLPPITALWHAFPSGTIVCLAPTSMVGK